MDCKGKEFSDKEMENSVEMDNSDKAFKVSTFSIVSI